MTGSSDPFQHLLPQEAATHPSRHAADGVAVDPLEEKGCCSRLVRKVGKECCCIVEVQALFGTRVLGPA